MEQIKHSIVVIGSGPAGMAAAVAAFDAGVQDVVILDREEQPGGILKQCIHNGFGLHKLGRELTGPEYAAVYEQQVLSRGIKIYRETTAISLSKERVVLAQSKQGILKIKAGAVILAMGCRERSRGALNIPGTRPAGVYSAGTAQKLMNCDGFAVGKRVVVLGSGDIGLIMARRLTLEGAKVEAVCELLPYSGGLKRNIVQCLQDYNIPLYLSTTVAEIHGAKRVEGVTVAKVDENRQTGAPGIFACGNVLQVHDLVDYVSDEAELAGKGAAGFVLGSLPGGDLAATKAGPGVRYVLPQKVHSGCVKPVALFLRVSRPMGKVKYTVCSGGVELTHCTRLKAVPGEMKKIVLQPQQLQKAENEITVSLEELK